MALTRAARLAIPWGVLIEGEGVGWSVVSRDAPPAFNTVMLELVLPLTVITLSLEAQLCTNRF